MPYKSWVRLILWIESEFRRMGLDIEVEVTRILEKLRNRHKS